MTNINNHQQISISESSNVTIGNIKNTINADSTENKNEIAISFSKIYKKIDLLPENADKADALTAIKALEAEANKGLDAQEKNVKKWLLFLLETAPDIGQVAIETFLNPIKGVSTVFQKIADKIKSEKSKK
jgi:hypothetical protein